MILIGKNFSFKRTKKRTFSKGVSPWLCPKIIISIIAVFSLELCHKRWFFDIHEREEWFLVKKIEVLKKVKNRHFLKGLVHGFCPKIEVFLIGVFHRNSIRKQHFWYCGKKRMFLSGKNWSFKKGQKIDIFHWFCLKIEFSLIAVFHRNYVSKDRFWIF